MKSARALKAVFSLLLFLLISPLRSQDGGMTAGKDAKNILPLRRQLKIMEECLAWRLDNIIPVLMRREGIDMWLTISSGEYARDPIGPSLFGANGISSGGTGTVVFHDRGPELGVERFSTGRGGLYKSLPADSKVDPFENLAKFIRERNPKKNRNQYLKNQVLVFCRWNIGHVQREACRGLGNGILIPAGFRGTALCRMARDKEPPGIEPLSPHLRSRP